MDSTTISLLRRIAGVRLRDEVSATIVSETCIDRQLTAAVKFREVVTAAARGVVTPYPCLVADPSAGAVSVFGSSGPVEGEQGVR